MTSARILPRMIVAGALAALVLAIIVIVANSSGPSRHAAAPPRPAPTQTHAQAAASSDLQTCAALWNAPANVAAQRAFAAAAGEAGAGTTVAQNAYVSRYPGPALADAGVGEPGVNVTKGACMVVAAANVAFAYTRNAWHAVGVSPETPVADAVKRAAAQPNVQFDPATGGLTLLAGG